MSLKRLFFIIIFISVFIMGFGFYINKAFLYSPETTHYNLTQEMIKFYNLTYEPDLTPRQTELILRGSIDEDIKPRPLFHMYDPVYNRAPLGFYTAKKWALENIQSSAIIKFANLILNIFSAEEIKPHADFSWPASVNYFTGGDTDKAYYGLGHILHLIEDMSVPAHSRNDPHVGGDPYEDWANINNGIINFNLAEPFYSKGYRPVDFYTIGEYFDNLAKYSNKYFFSEDSILNKDYNSPKITKERQEDFGLYSQRIYGLTMDEDGELFRLVEIVKDLLINKKVYLIQNDDQKLNIDYWTHLAPKAILYGAGVIKLFLEEAGYEVRKVANQPPELSWFQRAQIFIQDLFGIGEDEQEQIVESIIPSQPLLQPKPARFPDGGPAIQPVVQGASTDKTDQVDKTDKSDKSETTEKTGEVKGAAEEKDGQKGTGSIVVTGPKTGGGGGVSWREAQNINQPEVGGGQPQEPEQPEEPEKDTTPPDILIESLLYNYASSSLDLEWSSSEAPSVSFDIIYKIDEGEWDDLLVSSSENQLSLVASIQDIIYYFRVRATDLAGNQSNWQEKSIEILSKPVVINEIAWMGTIADYNDEWIELYNQAEYDIDLTDWILKSDDNSPEIIFVSGDSDNKTTINKIIPAEGYYLLERTNDETTSTPADWYGSFGSGGLKNTGEVLELRDGTDNLIDLVDSWYAGNNESKRTMERVNPVVAGTDSQNWQTYIGSGSGAVDADGNPILGTPKAQNSVYDAGPPSKIDDLAVSDSLGTFLILQWTAPSDEKSSLSLTYDIRYASESISEENWASLSQIADIPLVENPGTIQLASISGLKYNTTYYFAIKTSDGANISELSNVLVYSTGSPPTLAKSAWPIFQRDVGHTGLSPYAGPDFISSSSVNIKWSVDLGASVVASPVIGLDGTIYIGDIMGKFYAINPITGEPKWVYDTYNHELGNGGIYFSAAVASDDTIYFSAFGSYLYALTPNGKLKWKYPIGNPNTTGSSPVIGSDGTIYLTGNNTILFAINPDGTLKWEYLIGALSISSPALGSDETIYVSWRGTYNVGYLSAFAPDGILKWTTENINAVTGDVLTVDSNNIIYLGSYVSYGRESLLRAISSIDGSIIWSTRIGNSFYSAGTGLAGNIYIGSENWTLYAINPTDGSIIWSFYGEGRIFTSPAIDSQGVIYFGAEDGKIYAVNPDGTLKWDYELSDAIYSSPIIGSDGTIYIATADGKLYAIGE